MLIFIKFVDYVNSVIQYIIGALMVLMVLSVTTQIIVRSFFPNFGIIIHAPWTEEIPRYFLQWFIFLGASVGARSGDLIAVEALVDILGPRAQYIVKCCALFVTFLFFVVLIWFGVKWMSFGGSETSLALGMKMSWVYMSLPVGFFFASLSILARLIEHIHLYNEKAAGPPFPEAYTKMVS